MRLLHFSIPILFSFVLGTEYNLYQNKDARDLLHISAPQELGNYLLERLQHKDARAWLSKQCSSQVLEYARGLRRFRPWAWKMFDASAKIPSGLLRGHGAALGSFDECLSVNARNTSVGPFRGKYCLGGVRLLNLTNFKGLGRSESSGPPQSRLLNMADASIYLPWGVCLPDGCSARDFRFLHLFILQFPENYCQTEESQKKELDNGDYGAIAFLVVIGALITVSTAYEIIMYYTGHGRGCAALRTFSLYTSLSDTLIAKEEDIPCLRGIKALSMVFLMFGYRFIMYAFAPLVNWLELLQWLADKNKAMVIEAVIAADTFFVVSGMLVAYHYLKVTEKRGAIRVVAFYLGRIIRLTPGLAAAVLFHATLLRHVGSGPIWPTLRDIFLVQSCREHWWSALLYVQNYVNPGLTTVCTIQNWQLSADMQLFILSPLILLPLRRMPKYTLGAVGGLMVLSMVSAFLTAWIYDLKAVIITNRSLQDVKNYVEQFYFPMHTRATPWLIGFVLGYIVYEIRRNKLNISTRKGPRKIIALILWASAFGLMALCIVIGRELIGVKYNWLTHALHITFMRPMWALSISWMILACVTGYGGPINQFLSARIFYVISKISYGTYLLNITVMGLLTHQTRVGLEFDELDAVYKYFGDILFCFLVGFLWTVAFDSPFIMIKRLIFDRRKVKEDNEALVQKAV